MRLIDADAYIEALKNVPMVQEAIRKSFEQFPTIEAVPVIRCRECKWGASKKKEGLYHCRFWYRSVNDDDYCGRAERKEDD